MLKLKLVLLGLVLFSSWQVSSAAPPAPSLNGITPLSGIQHLTLVETTNVRQVDASLACYNFGTLGTTNVPRIVCTFVLCNNNLDSVTLDHLHPSCGCTSALVDGAEAKQLPLVIPHGQKVEVHVAVDSSHLSPGLIDKFVSVYLQGQDRPTNMLEITGTLQPPLLPIPATLDFGCIKIGQKVSRIFSVVVGSAFLSGKSFSPVWTDADLKVTEVTFHSYNNIVPLTSKQNQSVYSASTALVRHTYLVTLLPRIHMGQIDENISLISKPKNSSNKLAVIEATIRLQGEVIGEVLPIPSVVAFGTATLGQTSSQYISLVGSSRSDINNLKMSYPPYLTVRTLAKGQVSNRRAASSHLFLQVSLGPRMPIGSIRSNIIITTRTGHQLFLPVSGYVNEPVVVH